MGLSTRVLIVEDDDTILFGMSKGDMISDARIYKA